MVSVLASSAVDRGFQRRLDQTKDYKIGICCFFAKHAALMALTNFWCIMPTTVACQYDSVVFFCFSFYGTSKHEDFIVK